MTEHALEMTGGTAGESRRLLLPICATEESRWGLQYARQLQRSGARVEAILLNVGEPIAHWQVLRFLTQREIGEFQAARAQCFIDEASRQLANDGIPWRGLFRQGDLVFSILDAAEELACDEVVMPAERNALARMFGYGTTEGVRRRQRRIPLVQVDRQGVPH